MQTRLQSIIEVVTGRSGMLFLGALFSLWWIPKEAPTFLAALWKTWPYILIALVWNYLVRRTFERYGKKKL